MPGKMFSSFIRAGAIGALLLAAGTSSVTAQQAYFADGYHGGIYGHYPMWTTQFIVDKMDGNPLWKINMEIEPETWDTVKLREAAAYDNFRRAAASGRVEFTNPTYAQPYMFNISGESIIRQFAYGIDKMRGHFPDTRFTTYSAEEPCFTSCLPGILSLFGFEYAVLKNPDTCWGGYTAPYGGELVNWIGPDGTKMLTVPRYGCEALEDNSTWQTKAWNNNASYLKACFDYGIKNPAGMCFQDAGWRNGPWLGDGKGRHNRYVTWTDYIENISVGKTDDDWRFSQEDVLPALMWGSQVLQRIARQVRSSENRIVAAEKINSMAAIAGHMDFAQADLDGAWRTLMLAQHHDSWIVPYNGLQGRGTWADHIARWTAHTDSVSDAVIAGSAASLASDAKNAQWAVTVFNTTGIDSGDEVVATPIPSQLSGKALEVIDHKGVVVPSAKSVDADGVSKLTFQVNAIPEFGYATYLVREKSRGDLPTDKTVVFTKNGDCVIDNGRYRIVLDASRGGVIGSLLDRKLGKEFVDSSARFGLGEIRGYFYDKKAFLSSADNPVRITVVEDTPYCASVRIEGKIGEHPFTQIVSATNGKKGIDFDLRIDWKGNPGIGEYRERDWGNRRRAFYDTRYMLSVLFPNSLGDDARISKDAPFDVCESRLEDTFFNRWDSIKNNVILHWVDLASEENSCGLAVFTDHTTSYSHGRDFPLALTVQYSGGGLWGRNHTIDGPTQIEYALVPHDGDWRQGDLARESAMRNQPMQAVWMKAEKAGIRSLLELESEQTEVSAVTVEGREVTVRIFNASDSPVMETLTLDFPVEGARRVDLQGNMLAQLPVKSSAGGDRVEFTMPRFGIETIVFELKR